MNTSSRSLKVVSVAVFPVLAGALLLTTAHRAEATEACEQSFPAEVVQFSQGPAANPAGEVAPEHSDANTLIGGSAGAAFLSLGIGGTVTLKFEPPVVNYPAVGGLVLEAPLGAPSCADRPERAEISVSQDGKAFTVLGTVCLDATFDLGAFSWVSFVRIRDVTNPTDPAFAGNSTDGFDIRSIFGPSCLKREFCPVAAAPDARFSSATTTHALSIPSLATDLVLASDAKFEEYSNGTARLIGTLFRSSNPAVAYALVASFTGRVRPPPAGNPVRALDASAYAANGGPIDPAGWVYYRNWRGTLSGLNSAIGEEYTVARSGGALQLGVGANGRNLEEGASGAFTARAAGSSAVTLGELNVNLALCTGAAPPAPTSTPTPVETPEAAPTATAVPTATPTAGTTPTTTPETPTSTPEPTPPGTLFPTCTERNIRPLLLQLDGAFLDRQELIHDALKLLVRSAPSARNRSFRTEALADAARLHATNWSEVWTLPQSILSCDPSPFCVQVSFEPSRSILQSGAENLNRLVSDVLRRTARSANSDSAKKRLKRWHVRHQRLLQSFRKALSQIPESTTACG